MDAGAVETWLLFLLMKVLDGSHERAMLAWANSWISDRLDRMSKQGDSPDYECSRQLQKRHRRQTTDFHIW